MRDGDVYYDVKDGTRKALERPRLLDVVCFHLALIVALTTDRSKFSFSSSEIYAGAFVRY